MKVKIESETCIGCGACISICPDIFDFNDDGFAICKSELIKKDQIENVRSAIESCPVEAIIEE